MTLLALIRAQDPRRRFAICVVMRAWLDRRAPERIDQAVAARSRTWKPQG